MPAIHRLAAVSWGIVKQRPYVNPANYFYYSWTLQSVTQSMTILMVQQTYGPSCIQSLTNNSSGYPTSTVSFNICKKQAFYFP
jgi:predicted double-glycine peptidase